MIQYEDADQSEHSNFLSLDDGLQPLIRLWGEHVEFGDRDAPLLSIVGCGTEQ